MTIKDAYSVEGMVSTGGNPAWKDNVPEKNAEAVQHLVDAGAIIFGKTNVPLNSSDIQSYNEIYGVTNNPWNLERTPGRFVRWVCCLTGFRHVTSGTRFGYWWLNLGLQLTFVGSMVISQVTILFQK